MPLTENQQAEIEAQQAARAQTRRPTVPALEEILFRPIPVLDHGFVRVIDYMGDDSAIVQAARVSYGRGTKRVSEDAALICYLMRRRHTSPFEMCEIKLHVKLPIFVARQWIRHRTANVNEYSARYSILDREFYIPAPEHLAAQSRENRQGRGEVLGSEEAAHVIALLREDAERCYAHYLEMLNEDDAPALAKPKGTPRDPNRLGLARELARMNLTLNTYTQWYWKIDLHNLLHFLALRLEAHAQYEIRAYAEAIMGIVAAWVPITYQAFRDYILGAVTFSAPMLAVLQRMLKGERMDQPQSGLSKREWAELMAALGSPPEDQPAGET